MSERSEGRGTSVRVLVVDDHPVVRAGLRGMLAVDPGIDVIDEASSGERALALIERDPPDVVLMDLRMPGMDGVTATATITARYPAVRVLVVTTYDRDTDILRAVEAEIGRRLFIGEATVKTHLLRAFAKLGVDDRTAAVTVAMQRGILPPP
jgi:DNA-binding NarL/FixJ family response regulator